MFSSLHATAPRILAARSARRSLQRVQWFSDSVAHEESDIVIVGGGPAGLALASALGASKAVQHGLRVTLVEAGDLSKVREWSPPPGTFSNRVSSITNASQAFLQDIGVWPHVEAERTCPVEEMQVWDGLSDARITFDAPERSAFSGLARITENLNLQRALLRRLSTVPSVQLLDKVKVQAIQREERQGGDWPLVHLSDGRILRARLLVGADGFNSPVRAYAGIQSYGWAYDTHAIVATLFHAPRTAFEPTNTVAYQRFLPTGPIAFLPLSPTASSLVWSTKPHLARALKAADPIVLASLINAAFRLPEVSLRYLHAQILESQENGTLLSPQQVQEEIVWRERSHNIDPRSAYSSSAPSVTAATGVPPADADVLPPLVTSIQPGTIASFPLKFSHADTYIGEGAGARTVLVGDAAHTVHPLAGQGLNLGLADVETLSRHIQEAVSLGGDIGSYTVLQPYVRERYFENHKMLAAMDKLHKLYAQTAAPIVWARSVGVEVLNELDTIKAAMMVSAGSAGPSARTSGWSLAVGGVERFARTVDSTRRVADGVAGLVGAGVQGLLKQMTPRG
ncbi:ubiquinone biosynthesis hydrox [Sparassis latifolia]|uniref:Ubiquinone biosynthesis monooxygenase COQ6, mitochondrial n=1 Tax=Sparassis crispa TaxID=139825 RepID=A0A401GVN9_9APHY|nr:Ubiquinone biosynthesis monooxygenase COQ6, mitochondrial [Sparassis crispa]GBE86276.1 Ubiquinone biosynthesis monooxygenase COQ6, mitochondrial [Sparassis crispa]